MAKHAESFPVAGWVMHCNKQSFVSDLVAAVIVAIMLIPQSLAYAMLAGLPPEVCLYASIAPLIAYALLGTSSTLSVGPVLDRLNRTAFLDRLSGNLYFTQYKAFTELCARIHNSALSEEP